MHLLSSHRTWILTHSLSRRYNNGSVLRMHVDTVGTHVVSAIINVDQDVEQDWPLLILDHQVSGRSSCTS